MVKSADRAFDLLETIAVSTTGLTHSELAGELKIPKSSLTSLLSNMLERDYLVFNPETKRYSLGPMILFLAGRFLSSIDLVQLGQPIINDLMVATDESAGLTIRLGNEVLSVYSRNSPHPIMRSLQVGERAPLYATAAGRAMLAFLDKAETERYVDSVELTPITGQTIADPKRLLAELKVIRKEGVAFSRQELYEGSTAVAAPVFDMSGEPVASVRVVVPTMRCDAGTERKIADAVRAAGRSFSEKLGYMR